jgi:hypothetical protein
MDRDDMADYKGPLSSEEAPKKADWRSNRTDLWVVSPNSANESPAISRVLDLNQVDTYKIGGLLTPTVQPDLLILNPVPVWGAGRRIGFAMVSVEESGLHAQYFLVRDCPERLDLETGNTLYPSPLYASIKGVTHLEQIDLFHFSRGEEPLKAGG